jgi:hypothetical protein
MHLTQEMFPCYRTQPNTSVYTFLALYEALCHPRQPNVPNSEPPITRVPCLSSDLLAVEDCPVRSTALQKCTLVMTAKRVLGTNICDENAEPHCDVSIAQQAGTEITANMCQHVSDFL